MFFFRFCFRFGFFTIGLPFDKQLRTQKLVKDFLSLSSCKIREFAHLGGVLVSTCPATRYGCLYTKGLERAKFLALLSN